MAALNTIDCLFCFLALLYMLKDSPAVLDQVLFILTVSGNSQHIIN